MTQTWLEALFRWIHVVAGIAWIGHLYFFNFVNAQLVKSYDPETRRKVVPQLMPRALYWFRWGAVYTFASGILLAGMLYWSVEGLARQDLATGGGVIRHGPAVALSILLLLAAFPLYEAVWRVLGKRERVAVGALFALLVALVLALSRVFSGRAVFIEAGMMLGTIMIANVWMRIWPAQRKIIQAAAGLAPAPDAALVAQAGLRSKHNTYLSVALLFTMVSNHYPAIYGHDQAWIVLCGAFALSFATIKVLYLKSAGAAPARFGAPEEVHVDTGHGMAAPKP
jgi:uncharacterized membrane protein